MAGRAKAPVFAVTNAPKSLRADVRSREVRYLISMGIRTVCFVLAFLASGPLRWTLVVLAVVLPYIAVVLANAGRESSKRRVPTVQAPARRPELEASETAATPTSQNHDRTVESEDTDKSDLSGQGASRHEGTSTTSASP